MDGTTSIVLASFTDFWERFTSSIPTILVAVVLIFAGFIFAWIFESISRKILRALKLEEAVARVGIQQLMQKAGLKTTFTRLLSGLVYWFVLIVFLAAVVDIAGLTQLSSFADNLVGYLPNVIAAVAILIIGILVANVLYNVVKNATHSANINASNFLAALTKWSIFVFAFIAALVQLKIAPDLLKILFTGFVVMMSLAGGLAFGLGGKDLARDILEGFRRNVGRHE